MKPKTEKYKMKRTAKKMDGNLKKDPFRLGFGLMRLPKNEDGSIDIPQVCEMADRFIAAGGTYFDTAYVYDNGNSERAAKAALVDRYPRDSFTLATKINAGAALWKTPSMKSA